MGNQGLDGIKSGAIWIQKLILDLVSFWILSVCLLVNYVISERGRYICLISAYPLTIYVILYVFYYLTTIQVGSINKI